MKELLVWIIQISAFFAVVVYLINIIRFVVKFVRDSFWGKKIDTEKLLELLLVIFLGQYGLYVIEQISIKNGYYPNTDITKKTRNIYITISLLTIAWFVIPIIPNTRYGTEEMQSLIEKKHYQTYYNASLIALDKDYSEISPEMFAIAEVEHDDGAYWIGNVYVKNMGIYSGYSGDAFEYFDENTGITDIDGNNFKIKIFNQKPEFKVIEEFYTSVAGVTFDNDSASRQDILEQVKSGNKLVWLIREKGNQYDKNAVIVQSYYGKIGYIKADLAPYIANILDDGGIVTATVSEITGGMGEQFYGCNLHIEVLKQVQ